ncbi:MAG: hypothetical protein EOO22_23140, partial [Comamonadaceae bacterium]
LKRSYSFANYLTDGGTGRNISSVQAPSVTVMLCERINRPSNGTDRWGDWATLEHTDQSAPGSGTLNFNDMPANAVAEGRHLGTNNILYVDGHVKFYRPEQISYGFRANTSTSAEMTSGGTASRYAEGTEYSGPGARALTMSYR